MVRSTGRTLADWQQHRAGGIGGTIDLRAAVLLPDRDWLNARIDQRFAEHGRRWRDDEVAALLARSDIPADAPDPPRDRRARDRRVWSAARSTRDEAIAAGTAATRQYAKRQYTWFRNQPPPDWAALRGNDHDATDCSN